MYEDASDGGSEGEGHNHPPTWKMELKGGPAMASGLGLPQNQIMDIGAWGLSLAPRPSILGTRLVGGGGCQNIWLGQSKCLLSLSKCALKMGHSLGVVGKVGSGKGREWEGLGVGRVAHIPRFVAKKVQVMKSTIAHKLY